MSNLNRERIITITWLCNDQVMCNQINRTAVNTTDFDAYVPDKVFVDCPRCGALTQVFLGGLEAEVIDRDVSFIEEGE